MHMAIWKQEKMPVHSKKQAQVEALLFDKALIKVLAEYSNYNDVFSIENIVELSKNTRIKKHTIKLEKSKQLLFSSIYSLRLVELETLKIYIKINLANGFIWPFIFPTKALIFFDKIPNENLCFYVDYWGLNNITIKNQYLLSLIDKLLDQLSWARKFNQLNFTNAYYSMRICKSDK